MCQESGSFRFAADDPAPWWCAEPVELSDAMVEVDRLLKQWREILRVIPSLECRPRLLDALEVDEIIVDRERWALLVAIDGRRTVRELVQRSGRPVIDVCHVLLELVEAGAIGVIDPAASRPAEPEVEPEPEPSAGRGRTRARGRGRRRARAGGRSPSSSPSPFPSPSPSPPGRSPTPSRCPSRPRSRPSPSASRRAEYAPEPVPAGVAADGGAAEAGPAGSEPADKGAFLRLFSGLRES